MFSLVRLYIVEEAVLSCYQHCCVWQLYAMILDFLVLHSKKRTTCSGLMETALNNVFAAHIVQGCQQY